MDKVNAAENNIAYSISNTESREPSSCSKLVCWRHEFESTFHRNKERHCPFVPSRYSQSP
jgi:hypothetical protein